MPTGQHRSLGSNVSKVRSLKMDNKVWTEPLMQVGGHQSVSPLQEVSMKESLFQGQYIDRPCEAASGA